MKKLFSNQKTPILQSKITKNHTTQTSNFSPHTSNLFFSLLLSAFCFLPSALFGQVTIGKNAEPQPYSVLELYGQYETGSYGGLRLPQLTTPQRDALVLDAEAPGLMIFNSTTECMEMWNGAKWISFCDDVGGESGTAYVEINGIKWAKSNVNMPGHFAAHPYDAGRFYQWNRRMGWSSTDPMINSSGGITWNYALDASTTWEQENDPCPEGWRVPTYAELNTLVSATHEWGTLNGVYGYFIGDVEPKLFLPAAGRRYSIDGSLSYVGTTGSYWSSTSDSSEADLLYFFADLSFGTDGSGRPNGFSVRCVAKF